MEPLWSIFSGSASKKVSKTSLSASAALNTAKEATHEILVGLLDLFVSGSVLNH